LGCKLLFKTSCFIHPDHPRPRQLNLRPSTFFLSYRYISNHSSSRFLIPSKQFPIIPPCYLPVCIRIIIHNLIRTPDSLPSCWNIRIRPPSFFCSISNTHSMQGSAHMLSFLGHPTSSSILPVCIIYLYAFHSSIPPTLRPDNEPPQKRNETQINNKHACPDFCFRIVIILLLSVYISCLCIGRWTIV